MKIIKGVLEIKHAMPCRLRFKIKTMCRNPELADKLTAYAGGIPGTIRVKVNPKSSSLIIRYNDARVTQGELVESIKRYFIEKIPKDSAPGRDRILGAAPRATSVKSYFIRFGALSLVTASVFVKESILGGIVAQGLFSPVGLAVAVFSIPLIQRGMDHIWEKRFSLEVFLGASILVAAGAGEALAALEIHWITSGGEALQSWITEKSRMSIKDILQVTAKNTYVLIDGVEVEIPVSEVQEGDTLILHTGEKISVDGEIIKGKALLDESTITGRSETIFREHGDKVFAGTFVRQGVIFVMANKVGELDMIDDIYWELKPEDKAALIKEFKADGSVIAFAGDGVNDAPAMVTADLGICMPDGADIAKDAAQLVLMDEDLNGLARARTIAVQNKKTIKNAFKAAVGLNTVILFLASAGRLEPISSAILHNTSTVGILTYAGMADIIRKKTETPDGYS